MAIKQQGKAVNQIHALTIALVGFLALSCYALLSLFATISSASVLFSDTTDCLPLSPTLSTIIHIPTGSNGSLVPIKLPRNAQLPNSISNVEFNASWTTKDGSALLFSTYFFYNAQISIEYPIYRVEISRMDNNDNELESAIYDYTESCVNPRGLELFAGSKTAIVDTSFKPDPVSTSQRIKVKIWSGQY